MKKINLGQTISILANIGVIAGIVFLGIELRQNNQLLHAEAIGTVLETRLGRQELLLNNPHLIAIVEKNEQGEALTQEEHRIVQTMHNRGMIGWQKDYFLFQQGILSEEYLQANIPVMKNAFSDRGRSYGHMNHWQSWREVAAPGYREFIEQCIISDCETIPR